MSDDHEIGMDPIEPAAVAERQGVRGLRKAGHGYELGQALDEARDPWAHRSMGMRCTTCMWYQVKDPATTSATKELGRCRRHAPTMGGFPAVFPTDWCGDHKLDETRL